MFRASQKSLSWMDWESCWSMSNSLALSWLEICALSCSSKSCETVKIWSLLSSILSIFVSGNVLPDVWPWIAACQPSLLISHNLRNFDMALKGQSHEIDLSYFDFMKRSWPNCEPLMVFKFFPFSYHFISNLMFPVRQHQTLAHLQFTSYSAGKIFWKGIGKPLTSHQRI